MRGMESRIVSRCRQVCLCVLLVWCGRALGFAQTSTTPTYSNAIALPATLATDSYAIYSQLLPGSQIEWSDAPREFWLLEETTAAMPLGSSCATGGAMNPHSAIRPTDAQKSSFDEVLADFDKRCHERYRLDASQLHVKLPVHLLDEDAQKRFRPKFRDSFLPQITSCRRRLRPKSLRVQRGCTALPPCTSTRRTRWR